MEVPGDLAEGVSRLREFQDGELEEGLVVRLEMDLAAGLQYLPVQFPEAPWVSRRLACPLGGQGSQKLM